MNPYRFDALILSLCRFEPGELEPYLPLRVSQNEPLYSLPR